MSAALTKAELADYVKLDGERKELASKLAAVEKRMDPTKKKVKAVLEKNGWVACKRQGYQLVAINCGADISWRAEFTKIAGIERAEEIKQAAPQRKRVEVRG